MPEFLMKLSSSSRRGRGVSSLPMMKKKKVMKGGFGVLLSSHLETNSRLSFLRRNALILINLSEGEGKLKFFRYLEYRYITQVYIGISVKITDILKNIYIFFFKFKVVKNKNIITV